MEEVRKEKAMSIAMIFWIIMIVGLLFHGYNNRATLGNWAMSNLVVWVLLALLGWAVFGAAIHR